MPFSPPRVQRWRLLAARAVGPRIAF